MKIVIKKNLNLKILYFKNKISFKTLIIEKFILNIL